MNFVTGWGQIDCWKIGVLERKHFFFFFLSGGEGSVTAGVSPRAETTISFQFVKISLGDFAASLISNDNNNNDDDNIFPYLVTCPSVCISIRPSDAPPFGEM